MKITDDQFDEAVSILYSLWSKRYRMIFKKKRPESRVYRNKIRQKDQLEFVKMYLGYLMLDGKNKANLHRIMKFLLLQEVNSTGKLEIHFLGGSPIDVVVHVNNLREIDFSDTHDLIRYDSILINRKDKRWTQKKADAMFESIKYDLEFDGSTFNPSRVDISNGDNNYELSFDDCNIE